MLHGAVHWQKGRTVADLIDGVKNFTLKYLHFSDNLFRQSPLLSKDDSLSCAKFKVQLKEQISAGHVHIGLTEKNRLAITSNDHCPTELKDGKKKLPSDFGTGHEGAGNITIQHINM